MGETIGQAVALAEAIRIDRGLTHRQFAVALGRDETEWAHFRAGRREPSPAFLKALRTYAQAIGGGWPSKVDVAIQHDALAVVA